MASNQVAIVGLGPVAASMGLALRNAKQELSIVGTDRDWELAQRMEKLGAVNRLARNPAAACQGSGLIIITEPLGDIAAIFDSIAGAVSSGAVVTDIAPLKADVIRWAEASLPEGVSFVGGHPLVLAEVGNQPRADLFTSVQYCLVPAANATEQAMDVMSGLVALLGAQPYFLDAAEHDGLMAAVEGLPRLLQLTLLFALSRAGSWRDNQRAASRPFINATASLADDPALITHLCWLNRQNLALWIDTFQDSLSQIKAALQAEDEGLFKQYVSDLGEKRGQWLKGREAQSWDDTLPKVEADKRSVWSRLLLPELRKPEKKSKP